MKARTKLIGIAFIMLALIISVSACVTKAEPTYASQITEGILQAMNDNDYIKYTEHFDEIMKNATPEPVFRQTNTLIKSKVGDYLSKEFWKVEDKGSYTTVHYKAKFTKEPKDVIVRVVFQEIEGEIYVSGLWFDSPKLRQQ